MPPVGVAQGRAGGAGAGQQAAGLNQHLSCPPTGTGRGPGRAGGREPACRVPHAMALLRLLPHLDGFEELQAQRFSVHGTQPLCLPQSLAVGGHKAKGRRSPRGSRMGS